MNTTSTQETLTIHYPSIISSYYAVCGWQQNREQQRNYHFALYPRKTYCGPDNSNSPWALFQGDWKGEDTKIPSQELKVYWIQAPIPKNIRHRSLNITCNSGKFLVYIPLKKNCDEAWLRFKQEYNSGELGYGIQCASRRNSIESSFTDFSCIWLLKEMAERQRKANPTQGIITVSCQSKEKTDNG